MHIRSRIDLHSFSTTIIQVSRLNFCATLICTCVALHLEHLLDSKPQQTHAHFLTVVRTVERREKEGRTHPCFMGMVAGAPSSSTSTCTCTTPARPLLFWGGRVARGVGASRPSTDGTRAALCVSRFRLKTGKDGFFAT